MENETSAGKSLRRWRVIAIVAICLLVVVCIAAALTLGLRCATATLKAAEQKTDSAAIPAATAAPLPAAQEPAPALPEKTLSGEEMLSLWTADARAKNELIAYMEAITDENGSDYIPTERRIAVFDLDGTLFCETDPNYFDYTLLVHRVLEDPDYIDLASDFERETAMKIVEQNLTGASFKGLEVDHGKCIASAFAGMTLDEFNAYIQDFKQLPMPSYDGMLRGEGWYKPMLEVVEYLKANDFTVYVVSGTDRLIVRGIADNSPLGLPMGQIIGSDETIVTRDQNGEDGLTYVFDDDDELILGGDFLIKNLKMNKVAVIAQEIGVQPVLSFGNSTGDSSMAEYATSGNPYRSLAFMLCCDDLERENGNEAKADKMLALCDEFDWVPISMKNDWTTIYGDGVTKRETTPNEALETALADWKAAHEPEPIVLSDDSSDFVLLSEAVPDAILEIRYYSTYNFVGDRIDGYEEPLAFLTKEAAAALKEASDELLTMGYRLKIFDAYRPQMAVTHFMNWALDPDDTRMKEFFYPELDKDVLFPQGYIAEHSGHSRGSTVDLTLFDMALEKEVDMGGTFDYFGELSHPDYTGITTEQYANRMILREVMLKHGFKPLPEEWWHFTLADEPFPNTYFTFPINSDSVAAQDVEQPAEQPAEQPTEQPEAEQPAEQPEAEQPAEQPEAEQPAETAAETTEAQKLIEEMVVDYGSYGDEAAAQIAALETRLAETDADAAARWQKIMAVWKDVNTNLTVYEDVLPDGLADTDELCIVALGFQLNPDGTMREELLSRLGVVLQSAQKYPNAYIVCTGGGTAAENPSVTEAGEMAKWLIENGVAKERVIVEDRSVTTAQNAIYTLDILSKDYPQVKQLAIVSSQYHISTGVLLFTAEAILRAEDPEAPAYTVVSNAAWNAPSGSLSDMFRAGALIELSGNTEAAFAIYYETYDIHPLPAV